MERGRHSGTVFQRGSNQVWREQAIQKKEKIIGRERGGEVDPPVDTRKYDQRVAPHIRSLIVVQPLIVGAPTSGTPELVKREPTQQ